MLSHIEQSYYCNIHNYYYIFTVGLQLSNKTLIDAFITFGDTVNVHWPLGNFFFNNQIWSDVSNSYEIFRRPQIIVCFLMIILPSH